MGNQPIRLKRLAAFILVTIGIGFVSTLLGGSSKEIYAALRLPPLSPPSIVFPIVWNILYILIGTGAYLLSTEAASSVPGTLRIYWGQLLVNALWPLLFWRLGWYTLAAVLIIVVILLAIMLITRSYQVNRVSAVLFVPYLLWLIFALYLNVGVAVLN